jgi:hypothetical protein
VSANSWTVCDGLCGRVLELFSIFSIILLMLGHPEDLLSSTDTRLAYKMFSRSLPKHFKGSVSRFTELQEKLDIDMLLDSAIHRRQNETPSQKSSCVKKTMRIRSTVSRGRLMQ